MNWGEGDWAQAICVPRPAQAARDVGPKVRCIPHVGCSHTSRNSAFVHDRLTTIQASPPGCQISWNPVFSSHLGTSSVLIKCIETEGRLCADAVFRKRSAQQLGVWEVNVCRPRGTPWSKVIGTVQREGGTSRFHIIAIISIFVAWGRPDSLIFMAMSWVQYSPKKVEGQGLS